MRVSDVRARAGVGVTICCAFGPGRDLSSEDEAIRQSGLAYLRRCIDYAAELGSPFVSGPMYAAVGNTRLLDEKALRDQWMRAVGSLRLAAAYRRRTGMQIRRLAGR